MNPSTVIGIIASIFLLFGTILMTAEEASIFINMPGFFIVLLGTTAATLVSYPLSEVIRGTRMMGIVLLREDHSVPDLVDEIVKVAKLRMGGHLRKIEDELDIIENPFLRTGIQLVIDQTRVDDIINLMEWRIGRMQAQEQADAQIFHSMSHFAPAFGMFGTLVGLVNMLFSMGASDIQMMGQHMALALMTTLYGIILANLLFKPVAVKLERRTENRVMLMNMALEGVLLVREERSPSFIRQTLDSFAAHYDDELRGKPRNGVALQQES
jgi:chemotaxis protein MotA